VPETENSPFIGHLFYLRKLIKAGWRPNLDDLRQREWRGLITIDEEIDRQEKIRMEEHKKEQEIERLKRG